MPRRGRRQVVFWGCLLFLVSPMGAAQVVDDTVLEEMPPSPTTPAIDDEASEETAPGPITPPIDDEASEEIVPGPITFPSDDDDASGGISPVPVPDPDPPTESGYYRSAETEVNLQIYLNRLGVQTRSGAKVSDLLEIADAKDWSLVQSYYRGIFIFELPKTLSQPQLRKIARELKKNHSGVVRLAGLVADTDVSDNPVIFEEQVIFGFVSPPTEDMLQTIRDEYPFKSIEPLIGCPTIHVATQEQDNYEEIDDIAADMLGRSGAMLSFAHPNGALSHPVNSVPSAVHDMECVGELTLSQGDVDPYYCGQWHHDNRGLDGGVVDADIDTPLAWNITEGKATSPRIAIIDSSFSVTAGDLEPNLWAHVDGTRGRDFDDYLHDSLLEGAGSVNSHGTSVAGVVGAVAHNELGGRGVCPECELLLLRHSSDMLSTTSAVCYAIHEEAAVISNSWGSNILYDSIRFAIEQAASEANIALVFATSSRTQEDRCNKIGELSAIDEYVIAVSSITYQDDRTASGFGDCVDVLAPSQKVDHHGITTVQVYEHETTGEIKHETGNSFGGTSAATPMVAGTIGLMLDVAPTLTPQQVQRVLQDTADKVDPGNARYDPETGFSSPVSSTGTHAYGRINAFEAVSLVAPFDPGETDRMRRGRAGVDLVIRDHALDWGNTEQPSTVLFTPTNPRAAESVTRSVDIKIDASVNDFTITTPGEFRDWQSQSPIAGQPFRVYLRVRNRGPNPVVGGVAKLHWTTATDLPDLPGDFWARFPDDSATTGAPHQWNPLEEVDLPTVDYSGPSRIREPGGSDNATIVRFDVPAIDWDAGAGERVALLAVVHAEEKDPVVAKLNGVDPGEFLDVIDAVKWDNNVALLVTEGGSSADESSGCSRGFWSGMLVVLLLAVTL